MSPGPLATVGVGGVLSNSVQYSPKLCRGQCARSPGPRTGGFVRKPLIYIGGNSGRLSQKTVSCVMCVFSVMSKENIANIFGVY